MKTIILNGKNFKTKEEFYCEIEKLLTRNLKWKIGHNFSAYNDLLRGGFGFHESGGCLIIKWMNFTYSKKVLDSDFINAIIEITLDCDNSGHNCKLEIYNGEIEES